MNPRGAEGEDSQFENLWVAALISACAPCVPLLLVNIMIPDARQTDKLLTDGDPSSATFGSLFERWCGQSSYVGNPPRRSKDSTSMEQVELVGQKIGSGFERY